MHLSAHTWMRPEPLETTLQRLSRLGYASIELAGEPEVYSVSEVSELLQKYNLTCWGAVTVQHGSRNLLAANSQQRRTTIDYMKEVVSLAAGLGGKIVTVVPSTVGLLKPASTPEHEWQWAVEGMREVAAFAQQKGIRVAIEPLNRLETYFLNRVDQAVALAKEVGYDCGIAFDVFHLAIEEQDMFKTMRDYGQYIVDFHAADNNRLAPGDGSFDWPKIMATLKETGYDGAIAVEAMPPIDRTPVGNFGASQLQAGEVDIDSGLLEFIVSHGSGVLSEEYYTGIIARSAETLRPLID
jgi:D-psicose/D-tagatose/L-ribulose 3-epimerase